MFCYSSPKRCAAGYGLIIIIRYGVCKVNKTTGLTEWQDYAPVESLLI